jgi:hypothetical protein
MLFLLCSFSHFTLIVEDKSESRALNNHKTMSGKEEYKPKPSSKSEKNKPKGGAAKDAERAKKKAKDAEKAART